MARAGLTLFVTAPQGVTGRLGGAKSSKSPVALQFADAAGWRGVTDFRRSILTGRSALRR